MKVGKESSEQVETTPTVCTKDLGPPPTNNRRRETEPARLFLAVERALDDLDNSFDADYRIWSSSRFVVPHSRAWDLRCALRVFITARLSALGRRETELVQAIDQWQTYAAGLEAALSDEAIRGAIEASTFALQDREGRRRGAICINIAKFRKALSALNNSNQGMEDQFPGVKQSPVTEDHLPNPSDSQSRPRSPSSQGENRERTQHPDCSRRANDGARNLQAD